MESPKSIVQLYIQNHFDLGKVELADFPYAPGGTMVTDIVSGDRKLVTYDCLNNEIYIGEPFKKRQKLPVYL
jgi:hypothetical protein